MLMLILFFGFCECAVECRIRDSCDVTDFISFGYIPRSGIARPHSNYIFNFGGGNQHDIFHSGCTSSHSLQQCARDLFSPHPYQPLTSLVVSIIAILTGVRWCLLVILIYISLVVSDVKQVFAYLLAILHLLWKNVNWLLYNIPLFIYFKSKLKQSFHGISLKCENWTMTS